MENHSDHKSDSGFTKPIPNATATVTAGKIVGIAGCPKCNGTGYKTSKKSADTKKQCKSCMEKQKGCTKCNGTGLKLKDGKACKCKSPDDKKSKEKSGEKSKEKSKEKPKEK